MYIPIICQIGGQRRDFFPVVIHVTDSFYEFARKIPQLGGLNVAPGCLVVSSKVAPKKINPHVEA